MVSAIQTVGEKMDQQGLDSITVLKTHTALMNWHRSLQCLVQEIWWGGWFFSGPSVANSNMT